MININSLNPHINIIASAETYSGECGDTVKWQLDENTLTISGVGDMTDYKINEAPWYNYKDSITNIVIEKGVTSIGEYAFYKISYLTNITIPESVISIGKGAFYQCKNLENIIIPDNLTNIGSYAFYNCSTLTSMNIPYNVTDIEDYAFANCSNLKYITIPNSVGSIEINTFTSCNNLLKVYYLGNNESILNDIKSAADKTKNYDSETSAYQIDTITNVNYIDISTSLDENGNLAFTLIANEGYNLSDTVSVMVENSILTSGYSYSNSILNIQGTSITGNAIIYAEATPKTYQITSDLTNVVIDNSDTTITYGEQYSTNLLIDNGYTLTEDNIKVTMDGVEVSYEFIDNVLTVPNVTGNIHITAIATITELITTETTIETITEVTTSQDTTSTNETTTITVSVENTSIDVTETSTETTIVDITSNDNIESYSATIGSSTTILDDSSSLTTSTSTIVTTAEVNASIKDISILEIITIKKYILGITSTIDSMYDLNSDNSINVMDFIIAKESILNFN